MSAGAEGRAEKVTGRYKIPLLARFAFRGKYRDEVKAPVLRSDP